MTRFGDYWRRNLAGGLRHILGRRRLVRMGRYLLNAGRTDGQNSMEHNGELRLAAEVCRNVQATGRSPIVIDVGANLGEYSIAVHKVSKGQAQIYAVEACRGTYELLCENTSSFGAGIRPTHIAFSDHIGIGELSVSTVGAGTNSLVGGLSNAAGTERTELTTADAFIDQFELRAVDLIKVDAEGHDLSILKGAGRCLAEGRVGVIQFEYNWRWIGQRAYLRDVFELAGEFKYLIGKVTPSGIEYYSRWAPELESYVENNYALVHPTWKPQLSSIPSWVEL